MPILLVPYDPRWPQAFERARGELIAAIGAERLLGFEHIGSTAIPEIFAKPIIDMLAGVSDPTIVDDMLGDIEALGYLPWYGAPGRRTFERRGPDGTATEHLHFVVHASPNWTEPLRFRDWLRVNPADREAYQRLKLRLAAVYDDTRKYSEAKTEFVRQIDAKATRRPTSARGQARRPE